MHGGGRNPADHGGMTTEPKTNRMVVRTATGDYPLVVGPKLWLEITGDERSERSARNDCDHGVIPTLPRPPGAGAHHRIPVAKALERLGVPYEIVEAGRVEARA